LWLFIWSLPGTLKLRNLSFLGSDQMDNLLKAHIYATVEVDQEIPVEHYHAVAEVIGYVMRLKRGFSAGRG
jgi:hypothetical protein